MARLYIDVTRLMDRRGNLTGIPRVLNEIATRYLRKGGCTLLIWDGLGFVAVDEKAFSDWQQSRKAPARSPSNLLQRAVSKANRARLQRSNARKRPDIRKGDVLLIGWGMWSDGRYIAELELLQRSGVHLVEFAYDVVPLVAPQFFPDAIPPLDGYARRIYPGCALILAISRRTRSDLEGWLRTNGLKAPRIEVIRLGDDFQVTSAKPPTHERLGGSDYILCVGTVEPRKNHMLLVYVYKMARQRGIALPKLVVVGRRGWMSDSLYALMTRDPEVRDQFVLLENISDEQLSWLYQNCLFSIYPSFYEGWGLPIAESIAHGAPCITSNTTSMPEIAGDLVSYFSPTSTDECLQAVQDLLRPGELERARLKIQDYRPTSWDETFEAIDKHVSVLL